MSTDLRLGRWQDVLADVKECDALITDPPYSERTHSGALSSTGEVGVQGYDSLSADEALVFVTAWQARVRNWIVIHTDDQLHPVFRAALDFYGWYTFPMLPVLQHQPRQMQDGPAPSGHLLCVARRREARFTSYNPGGGWGSLPGWYEVGRDASIVRGGKPIELMRAIIRDYTRPGDLIVDPCAGGGTTLLAAAIEGRRAIGSEMDPETFAKAKARLERGYTPDMFAT